jgi:hypothetical protein
MSLYYLEGDFYDHKGIDQLCDFLAFKSDFKETFSQLSCSIQVRVTKYKHRAVEITILVK